MSVIALHDTNVLEVDCAGCGGTGECRMVGLDPVWCSECGGSGTEFFDLNCLLTNLAIAGALCAAWTLGFHAAVLVHTAGAYEYWRPGCRWSAK